MRCLHVKNGFVVNVVEYPGNVPDSDGDEDVVPAVTGAESVGDAFDVTASKKERILDRMDVAVFNELFNLTNDVRVLQGKAKFTRQQYKDAIRARL